MPPTTLPDEVRRLLSQEDLDQGALLSILAAAASMTPQHGRRLTKVRKILEAIVRKPSRLLRREGKARRALAELLAKREGFRAVLGDDWVLCLDIIELHLSTLLRRPGPVTEASSALASALTLSSAPSTAEAAALPRLRAKGFASDEEEPPRKLGRYKLERELGRGGAGVVYLGYDARNDRPVALKTVLDLSSESASKTLVREARNAARITSAHCVRILDVFEGQVGPKVRPVIVMEYVPGEDAEAFFENGPLQDLSSWPLTPTASLLVLEQMLSGLTAAHEARLIHRDIKPSNYLIAGTVAEAFKGKRIQSKRVEEVLWEARHEPWIKLNDLGLARRKEDRTEELRGTLARATQMFGSLDAAFADPETRLSLVEVTLAAGTPVYMAPEQLRKPYELSERTDVFALGLVFYTILTGAPVEEGRRVGEGVRLTGGAEECLRSLARVSKKRAHAVDVKRDPKLRLFARRFPDSAPACLSLLERMTRREQPERPGSAELLEEVRALLEPPAPPRRKRRRSTNSARRLVSEMKEMDRASSSNLQQLLVVAVLCLAALGLLIALMSI